MGPEHISLKQHGSKCIVNLTTPRLFCLQAPGCPTLTWRCIPGKTLPITAPGIVHWRQASSLEPELKIPRMRSRGVPAASLEAEAGISWFLHPFLLEVGALLVLCDAVIFVRRACVKQAVSAQTSSLYFLPASSQFQVIVVAADWQAQGIRSTG